MKIKTVFILGTIVMGLFGLAFLLFPEALTTYYGNTLGDGGVIFARLWGGATLALASILWFARDAEDSEARRAIVIGGFVYSILGLIVALYSQLMGMVNSLGWSTVIIYFLFAVDFGYFLFKKSE